jgi:hypothetical protein
VLGALRQVILSPPLDGEVSLTRSVSFVAREIPTGCEVARYARDDERSAIHSHPDHATPLGQCRN